MENNSKQIFADYTTFVMDGSLKYFKKFICLPSLRLNDGPDV